MGKVVARRPECDQSCTGLWSSELNCLTLSAVAFEHSLIHLAQVKGHFQPLARDAHQLFIAALTGSFESYAQGLDLVLLRSQSLNKILFGHKIQPHSF